MCESQAFSDVCVLTVSDIWQNLIANKLIVKLLLLVRLGQYDIRKCNTLIFVITFWQVLRNIKMLQMLLKSMLGYSIKDI